MKKFKGRPYRIISYLLLVSLFFNFSLFYSIPSVYAQSPKLKDPPAIKLYKSGGGMFFDREKEEPETAITNAKYAGAQKDKLLKLWTYASAWGGTAKSSLRGIDYIDFYLDGDVPKGTRVKSSLLVPIECHGYVNRADFSGGDTRYYIKLETGFLTQEIPKSWDAPALGKTLFAKTDDTNPPGAWKKDLAEKVVAQIASTLIEEGAKAGAKALGASVTAIPVVGLVVQVIIFAVETAIKIHEFGEDTEKIEFSFSVNDSIEYKDIWLTVGDKYRVYISLDSQTEAQGTLDNMSFVYVDFYNHPPHFGDHDGKWMQRRGFRIKDVYLTKQDSENIIVSEDHWYPVLDIAEFKQTTDEPLRLNKEIPLHIKFTNKGKRISDRCKVRVIAPDNKKSFDINLNSIPPGKSYTYFFKYTFEDTGNNTFTVTVDPEKKLDEYFDLTVKKRFSINIASLPDLEFEIIRMPDDIAIDKEASVVTQAKNIGRLSSPATTMQLLLDGKVVQEKRVKSLAVGGSEIVNFKWIPKEEKRSDFVLKIDPENKIEEYYEDNNEFQQEIYILAPEYRWNVEELTINPSIPKTGDEARIYFTIKNNGRSQDSIPYHVLVDDKNIKIGYAAVRPNSSHAVGKTIHDKITWKASGGRHTIKVILDPQNTFSDLERVGTTQELVLSPPVPMPAVSGVDFVIDEKDVSIKNKKINFKIYNRGTRGGTTDIYLHQYDSGAENPVGFNIIKRAFAAQSYEYFAVLLPPDARNSKMEITIDKNNMVKEVSEDNNSAAYVYGRYKPYEPPPPPERATGPDLTVAQIVNLDTPIKVGRTRQIEVYIGNLNMVDAKGVDVEYEFLNLDRNNIQPSHGYLKGTKSLGIIRAESRTSFTIPYKGVYPGRYKLTVIVDPEDKVQETDEYYNNQIEKLFNVGGEVTSEMYFSGRGADLSIDEEINVSNLAPAAGTPVNFEVTARNNSGIDVWGADLDMLVDGELVDGQALGTFAASSSKTLSFNYTFAATGDYVVKLMVDAKEAIPETDEGNNTATITISVQPGAFGTGHRDVAVTSINLSKTSCFQGELVTATATIKNLGQDTLNGVLCTIGPSGRKPFYVKVLPVLELDEEVEISVTLPALVAGDHTIEGRVDGKNIFKEENEENNILATSIHVEPISAEGIKEKSSGAVLEKIGNVRDAFNRWLRGWGKSKE
ncbi:CARDB domain-containing protein [Candidatus Omnitrophota bacterium]